MENKILNITNGDAFNDYFIKNFSGEALPFREVMMDGDTVGDVYSEDFIRVRASSLNVTPEVYRANAVVFDALKNNEYSDLCLYFGKDTFCQMNLITLLAFLEQIEFAGRVFLNYIDDETFEIVQGNIAVNLGLYEHIYKMILLEKRMPKDVKVLDLGAIEKYFDYHSDDGKLASIVRENSDKDDMAIICTLIECSKEYGISDIQAKKLVEKYKS